MNEQNLKLNNSPILSLVTAEYHRFANILQEKAENLAIIDYPWMVANYMSTNHRDPIIAQYGPTEHLPPIIRRRTQNLITPPGLGIYVYQNRLSPEIKYIIFSTKSGEEECIYLIIPQKHLFQYRRNVYRANRKATQGCKPPILAKNILEEVLQDSIMFLLRAKEIEKYGVKIKRGIILDGPPGNGKSMLCRYIQRICSENSITWGAVTSADIDQAYEDKEMDYLFRRFQVTFFDDIDVGYMDRGKGNGKMACSLLTAMDGMYTDGHLVRIFTTNEEVKDLDDAFTRPGRIDKIITINKPDESLRARFVQEYLPDEIREAIDCDDFVRRTHDFSFAEIEAIRTCLVTNKIFGTKVWDLNLAFEEYHAKRGEKDKRLKMGFGTRRKR